jgi:hypothetical protein
MGFWSKAWHAVADPIAQVVEPIADVINDVVIQPASDILAASDDYITQPITAPISQLTSALDDAVIQPVTEPISKVGVAIDDAVAEVIPGGWGTLAQIAAAALTMGQSIPIQAAAAAAASAGSDYAKNKDIKSAAEKGAVSGATRYGLGTLGEMMNAPAEIGLDPDLGMPGEASGPPIFNPEAAVTSLVPEATVQSSPYNLDQEYIKWAKGMMDQGYSPAKTMTDTGEFVQGSFDDNFSTVPNVRTESALGSFDNEPDLQRVSDVTTSKVPNAKIEENKFGPDLVPFNTDVPVYYKGVEMTPAQVAADNPSLYADGKINEPGTGVYYNLPPEYRGLGVEGINQKYNNLPGAISEQYANQDLTEGYDKVKFRDDPVSYLASRGIEGKDYVINKATGAIDYLSKTSPLDYPGDLYDAAKDFYKNSSKTDLAMLAAGAYGLSNLAGGSDDKKGKSQAQIDAEDAVAKKVYTYGTAGKLGPNYLLPNRVNASNVYSDATGYRPLTRYANGGEVEHFGIGGKISDALTRVAQPFEKAIIRPIGEAAPFLKDLAPYAGMAAGAMMGNPAVAAGIGGIASGFGKPGGFDMKRALMGGIAAYGMSNLAGGLEAAGAETALPPIDGSSTVPDYLDAMRTANTPYTAEEAAKLIKPPTISRGTGVAPRDMFSLRDTDAMQRGIGNLLQNSNTPAYKDAMGALTKNVGMFSTGVPIVMGTTGMMGVDESNALKKEYDAATAKNQEDSDKFNARVAAGKKRAQQAVSENPYMFAIGGAINPPDDQTQLANQTPMQNINQQAQMAQSANNNLNNGISGLFNQLTSNQPNNSMSYSPQTGSPQSVVLPSYGDSGPQGNSNIGFAQGGLSSIYRQQQRQQMQQQRQDQRQQQRQIMQSLPKEQRQDFRQQMQQLQQLPLQQLQQRQQQPFMGQPPGQLGQLGGQFGLNGQFGQPQQEQNPYRQMVEAKYKGQLGNQQQYEHTMGQPPGQFNEQALGASNAKLAQLYNPQQPFMGQPPSQLGGQFGSPQQAQPFGGYNSLQQHQQALRQQAEENNKGELGYPQQPGQLGNQQQPQFVGQFGNSIVNPYQNLGSQFGYQVGQLSSPQNPLIGPQQLPPLSGPLGGLPPQQPFGQPQQPQYDSTNSTTSKNMGYPLQQPFGSPQQPTVNSNPTIGPQQQSFGGLGSNPQGGMGFASGGMLPRFLSGGGDGMSDSIRANIEGTQEARLADGEFVIPADVVSHLGNGSSKAGARQLYSMMDRVRKARTGNPKQGREIKPTKLMPV